MAGKMDNAIVVALIGAAALVMASIITTVGRPGRESPEPWLDIPADEQAGVQPTQQVPRTIRMKKSYCNDPRTGQPYTFDIPSFLPKYFTHLDEPFYGDAVNPGHKFYLPKPIEAPGFVLGSGATHCRYDGTHEGITYCGPLRAAKGQPTRFAEIEGWINGEGGATYMTVAYQMPCEVPDDKE
jgi:hypothetical protein